MTLTTSVLSAVPQALWLSYCIHSRRTFTDVFTIYCLFNPVCPLGELAFPDNLIAWQCSRSEIAEFTKTMKEMNVQLIGLCCGNVASYIRTMSETLGRTPEASQYSPDMSQHLRVIAPEAAAYRERFHDNDKTL